MNPSSFLYFSTGFFQLTGLDLHRKPIGFAGRLAEIYSLYLAAGGDPISVYEPLSYDLHLEIATSQGFRCAIVPQFKKDGTQRSYFDIYQYYFLERRDVRCIKVYAFNMPFQMAIKWERHGIPDESLVFDTQLHLFDMSKRKPLKPVLKWLEYGDRVKYHQLRNFFRRDREGIYKIVEQCHQNLRPCCIKFESCLPEPEAKISYTKIAPKPFRWSKRRRKTTELGRLVRRCRELGLKAAARPQMSTVSF